MWNFGRQKLNILDFSIPTVSLKSRLKLLIHTQQALGAEMIWEDRNILVTDK